MRLPRPIERAARFIAIPHLIIYLIALQVICLFAVWRNPEYLHVLSLDPDRIVAGEWWRLISFLFIPINLDPLWAFVGLYFLYYLGTLLEVNWGTVRFNVYIWIGLLFTEAAAFIPWALGFHAPNLPNGAWAAGFSTVGVYNGFVYASIFLAVAFLYPNMIVRIMFIFPVQIKWLALVGWLMIGAAVVVGDWAVKAVAVASVSNFLLFFWHDLYHEVRFGRWSMKRQLRRMALNGPEKAYMHKCFTCGITDRSNPTAEFRYCTECGGKCYCLPHLYGHIHNNLASPR